MVSKAVSPRQRAVFGAALFGVTSIWSLVIATEQHVAGGGWQLGAAVVVGVGAGIAWGYLEDPSPTSDTGDAFLVAGAAVSVLVASGVAESIWGQVARFWLLLAISGLGVAMTCNFVTRVFRTWKSRKKSWDLKE